MNRKMIGWIALAVIVVGGLFWGMNAALGSEPPPKANKNTRVATKPAASSSAAESPDVFGAAKGIFKAIQESNDEGSDSPLGFLNDIGKDDENKAEAEDN